MFITLLVLLGLRFSQARAEILLLSNFESSQEYNTQLFGRYYVLKQGSKLLAFLRIILEKKLRLSPYPNYLMFLHYKNFFSKISPFKVFNHPYP